MTGAENIAIIDCHFDVPSSDKRNSGEETNDKLSTVEWSTVKGQHTVQVAVDSVALSLTPDLVVFSLAGFLVVRGAAKIDLLGFEVVTVDGQVDLTKW